ASALFCCVVHASRCMEGAAASRVGPGWGPADLGGACLSGRRVIDGRPAVVPARGRMVRACECSFVWGQVTGSRSGGNGARSEREAACWMVRGELDPGLEDRGGALMSTEVISQPSISHRGRRRLVSA